MSSRSLEGNMNEVTIGIIGLAVVLLMFLTGIELGFAMAIVGFVGFSIIVSTKAALNLLAKDIFDVFAPFASVAVPEMDRYNYAKKLSTGIVATVGTLGILIPPSVTLIVFGIITEQSIGKLFLAGLIPGLIIAFFFICIIYVWCKINPNLGPPGERSTWKERIASLPEFALVGFIFLLMIWGLMKGMFTPTEAGSVGTAAVLPMSIIRKEIKFKGVPKTVSK